MLQKINDYIRGSVEELHQVRWPTRQQALRLSWIVVVFVLASGLALGIIDLGLAALVRFLLSFA